MSPFEQDARFDDIIRAAVKVAAATGPLVLIPGADVGGLMGIWGVMATGIAQKSGVTLSRQDASRITSAALEALRTYRNGVRLFNALVHRVPGLGRVVASGANSAINVLLTVWFAFTLIDKFAGGSQPADLPGAVAAEVKVDAFQKVKRAGAFFRRWVG